MSFYSRSVLLSAAWLHDAVEDTAVTVQQIATEIDPRVALLVSYVTDSPGHNRAARKAATYPKIRTAGPPAVALKLADRLANVASAAATNLPLFRMYQKERDDFGNALYRHDDGLDPVWDELESLLKAWGAKTS
jgi:(p)ppGpp synthase/HD superfamily hydrolase